ncbi:hypothetical protein B1748_13910 [Paenibacillus sp. MY03]|jgi:adenosylcobinamide hydrolase|uniref:adenosylcobinamide amidohydrolase n=1 Tax=Paenibacillus sp. MY03 TaxID=302980 RepID=UPI000B3CE558|nr:adenosylcobinamide amidohydrolase [Paenibacillus sp. MY03]OUS75910.1 hypothetical protein B1748_13910 [Paenibacillus sp. MY03]
MTQPFRTMARYSPVIWPELSLELEEDLLRVTFPVGLHVLSSAILPGGFSEAETLLNWKVPLDYGGGDPLSQLSSRCQLAGEDPARTIGFMTAAKLTHASIQERDGDQCKLVCCATAGTRNAARAGYGRETYSAYDPGTINIAIFIDGRMTESAMAGAIITATEAKSAALQELGIKEWGTERLATGTTTDAIAVCVSQRGSETHAYAGVATTIGCAIGEAVFQAVWEAVATQSEA